MNTDEDDACLGATDWALSLADMVKKITPANRHTETETGDAQGREVW